MTESESHRVLVVDDEPDITALVAYHLAKAGYRVITAANGRDALRTARQERPDLVVLDLMLPGVSGYDVLAELRGREETKDLGVILLTARKDEPDRIKGLSLGADDYLPKPFSPQELVLRVGAVLRRLAAPAVAAGGIVTAGRIALDRGAHRVTVDAAEIELTATEFKLLRILISRRARWTCTSSGCDRSSARPATVSKPCGAQAIGSAARPQSCAAASVREARNPAVRHDEPARGSRGWRTHHCRGRDAPAPPGGRDRPGPRAGSPTGGGP